MSLRNKQIKALHKALSDHFTVTELEKFIRREMAMEMYDVIGSDVTESEVFYNWVVYCADNGKLKRFAMVLDVAYSRLTAIRDYITVYGYQDCSDRTDEYDSFGVKQVYNP